MTDDRGFLSFENLPTGDYVVECPSRVNGASAARTVSVTVTDGTVADVALAVAQAPR